MYHVLFVICIYIPISCIAFGIQYYYCYTIRGSHVFLEEISDDDCAEELVGNCDNCGKGIVNKEFGPPCVCDYTGCSTVS